MVDFSYSAFTLFLNETVGSCYGFQTISHYYTSKSKRMIFLRHDIDAKIEHALQFARIEKQLGIIGTYFFRTVPGLFDPDIIKQVHSLGHEIGYHYEDLATCDGDMKKAIKSFEKNLGKIRQIVPIKTICMHGSPRSKYDNRDLWKKYDYHKFDIIAEVYLDTDFRQINYYSDTGRRWDGERFAVRDKVIGGTDKKICRSTFDLIEAFKNNKLGENVMLTFHPQRWTNNPIFWITELIGQNVKNTVKYFLYNTGELVS